MALFNFLTVGEVKRTILHSVPSSKDQSNRCGDIAIFVIFQDGGRRHRHLVFSKIQIFNGACAAWGQYSSLCHISSESVERWQRYGYLTGFFLKWRPSAILDLLGPPTITTWWSLWVCQIWLKLMQ